MDAWHTPGLAILQSVESWDPQAIKNNIARLQKELGEHRFKVLLDKVSKELGLEISYELS